MRRHLATPLGLVAVLFVAGCSASKNDAKSPGLVGFEQPNAGEIGAQVASYEIVAQRPQRVSVGLVAGSGKLVGYGTVSMRFTPAGQAASTNGEPDVVAVGRYVVVAGHETSNNTSGPRFISGSEGIGVYRSAVTFPQPGTWRVLVTATIDGTERSADAEVEVYPTAAMPGVGDVAPATKNRLVGNRSVPPSAIDSRAIDGAPVPDPELHTVTIADAIARKRPALVVVSTPTYCQSRFCGPITDAVAARAKRFGSNVDFIHVEVWNDYATTAMNREAAEWILRDDRTPQEPWVFLIDRNGRIAERFDNIVSDADLDTSLKHLLN